MLLPEFFPLPRPWSPPPSTHARAYPPQVSPLRFKEEVWYAVSPHAKDLIMRLMAKDPMRRPEAKQVGP